MFFIDDIPIESDIFLSPMAGISDSPYRLLCRRSGSGFSFSEFVSADALIHENKKARDMLRFHPDERPVIFQIFGNEPEVILRAALIAESLGPDIIDLNMGCSVHRVTGRGSGSALLRDPIRAGNIVKILKKNLQIPITAKIRLGWDEKSRNFLEVARILEDSGVAMISVHGRTRSQGFRGDADWDAIARIKESVSIPILGNGDIKSFAMALEKKSLYGLDGVLIGRAAIGNPWIFSGKNRSEISPAEIVDTALYHLHEMVAFYDRGLILFRKHAARYFSGFNGAVKLRSKLLKCQTLMEFEDISLSLKDSVEKYGLNGATRM